MTVVRPFAAAAMGRHSVVGDLCHGASPGLILRIDEKGQLGNARLAVPVNLHITGATMSGPPRVIPKIASCANETAPYAVYPPPRPCTTNITQPSHCLDPSSIAPTVLPYSNTKVLELYDNRCDVSVYDQGPQCPTVYATPIDLVQLWTNTPPHKLTILDPRPLFQDNIRLLKAYIERRSVILAILKTVKDPIEHEPRRDHYFLTSTATHPQCRVVAPQQSKTVTISQKSVLIYPNWLLVILGCVMRLATTGVSKSSDSNRPF